MPAPDPAPPPAAHPSGDLGDGAGVPAAAAAPPPAPPPAAAAGTAAGPGVALALAGAVVPRALADTGDGGPLGADPPVSGPFGEASDTGAEVGQLPAGGEQTPDGVALDTDGGDGDTPVDGQSRPGNTGEQVAEAAQPDRSEPGSEPGEVRDDAAACAAGSCSTRLPPPSDLALAAPVVPFGGGHGEDPERQDEPHPPGDFRSLPAEEQVRVVSNDLELAEQVIQRLRGTPDFAETIWDALGPGLDKAIERIDGVLQPKVAAGTLQPDQVAQVADLRRKALALREQLGDVVVDSITADPGEAGPAREEREREMQFDILEETINHAVRDRDQAWLERALPLLGLQEGRFQSGSRPHSRVLELQGKVRDALRDLGNPMVSVELDTRIPGRSATGESQVGSLPGSTGRRSPPS